MTTKPKVRLAGSIKNATFPTSYWPKKARHLIDDISYADDFIVCTCAWKGPIDDFQPHRKENGERRS